MWNSNRTRSAKTLEIQMIPANQAAMKYCSLLTLQVLFIHGLCLTASAATLKTAKKRRF